MHILKRHPHAEGTFTRTLVSVEALTGTLVNVREVFREYGIVGDPQTDAKINGYLNFKIPIFQNSKNSPFSKPSVLIPFGCC